MFNYNLNLAQVGGFRLQGIWGHSLMAKYRLCGQFGNQRPPAELGI